MKKIAIWACMLFAVIVLAGCADKLTESNSSPEEVKDKKGVIDKKENDTSENLLQIVKGNIQNQVNSLNGKDFEKFNAQFHDKIGEKYAKIVKEAMGKNSFLEVSNINILHLKNDEVLAYYEGKLMTETYDDKNNLNQKFKNYLVLKNQDNVWKALHKYDESAEVLYLNEKGEIASGYNHKKNNVYWEKELETLKKNDMLPTKWMDMVYSKISNL